MKEFEFKRVMTKETYEALCRWCKQLYQGSKHMQINYYYDTPDGTCHGSNITVRVRQKGTELKGTIKYHGIQNMPYASNEQHFKVHTLPMYMEFGGRWISFMGQMVTERICFPVAEGVELMLDRNSYLGKVDYELELEFLPQEQYKAEAFLQWLEQQFALQMGGKHKSARFFDTLFKEKGREVPCKCQYSA